MTQATLSFNMTSTEISLAHNNREITVPHSSPLFEHDNYYWVGNKSLQQTYTDLFNSDVEQFNSKQKRNDRKIGNYLEKVTNCFEREKDKIRKLRGQGVTQRTIQQNKKAVKPCYEFIVALGSKSSTPQFCCADGEQRLLAREILQRYIEDFAERYNGKNFGIEMFNSAIHLDEVENNGVVHGHINIVFHSNNNTRGMQHQVSMNRALNQLGFCGDEKTLPITQWEQSEREILKNLCAEYGIEIVSGKGGKKHLHKEEYILEQEREKLECEKEQFTDLLFETGTGNTFLVMRENDDLREELTSLKEKNTAEETRLSELWEWYKNGNSQYWKQYTEHKIHLKKEIALAVSQKRYDQEQLKYLFNSVFADNGFILTRLFRLISALFLKFKIDREEQQLLYLQKLNKQLKEEANRVCSLSRATAEALKSKDFEKIYTTLETWETTLKTVSMTLENRLEHIAPEQTEQER